MLHIYRRFSEINIDELMKVYEQSNRDRGTLEYPDEPDGLQITLVEQDFYNYLNEDFFSNPNSLYFIWEEEGKYLCAARLEQYKDGFLVEGIETRPTERRMGYASLVLSGLLKHIKENMKACVYSHVKKNNKASLALHKSCGFEVISDAALLIDGSFSREYQTMVNR